MVVSLIDTLGNVRRLLVKRNQNGTAPCVEPSGSVAPIADAIDHLPHEVVEIHLGRRGDLPGDEAKPRIDDGLTGNPAGRILAEEGIQNRIADLITDLVGMAFRHGFRGEDVTAHGIGSEGAQSYV